VLPTSWPPEYVDTVGVPLGTEYARPVTFPLQTWVTTVGDTMVWETRVRPATVMGIFAFTATGKLNVSVAFVVPVDVTLTVGFAAVGNCPLPNFRRLGRWTFADG
jgi:hypothetical protein